MPQALKSIGPMTSIFRASCPSPRYFSKALLWIILCYLQSWVGDGGIGAQNTLTNGEYKEKKTGK